MLDDFEDMNNEAEPNGWWYGADDDTGPDAQMSVESISGRGESQFAVRFSGGPTTEWGSFLGLDLPDGSGDLSRFDQLVFFARSDRQKTVSVRFLDPAFGHYGVDVELSTEWQEYREPLASFVRTDDSGEVLDPSRVIHLQFWVPRESPAFQFWIDDVWLIASR